jgi:hypothetical protein
MQVQGSAQNEQMETAIAVSVRSFYRLFSEAENTDSASESYNLLFLHRFNILSLPVALTGARGGP